MKQTIIILIIFLLLVQISFADESFDNLNIIKSNSNHKTKGIEINITEVRIINCEKEIKQYANTFKALNVSELNIIKSIDYSIDKQTEYQFYIKPRPICDFYKSFIGDCTDRAILKVNMLKSLGINVRLVHGYQYYNYKRDYLYTLNLHDWYEFKLKNESQWRNLEDNNFIKVKKKGNGVW